MTEEKDLFTEMSKMSGLLAHELRNPLAAAMGQAELLQTVLPAGQVRDKIDSILSELERLHRLSEALLTFIQSRRIERVESGCAPLVMELARLDARLIVHHEQMPARWHFDTTMLFCAVKNVVVNALSFTGEDGRVELTIVQEDDDMCIEVRDFGQGLPKDIDIFEPFVTTRFQGAGLGMAIAAEIVQAHGGLIQAQDHPGGGAIVRIVIPRLEAHDYSTREDSSWLESSLQKMRITSATS